jgi:hypothetical protein
MDDFRHQYRDRVFDVRNRSEAIRANSLFQIAKIAQGGERHLLQIGEDFITSSSLGGVHALGDTVLIRRDSGQSFFY